MPESVILYKGTYAEKSVRLPKIKPPRMKSWIFWRLYGALIYNPARRVYWSFKSDGWFRNITRDWMWGKGIKDALIDHPIRNLFNHVLLGSYDCPCCGFEDWLEDELQLGEYGDDMVEFFDCVNSGDYQTQDGDTYWWEGWKFCYRCGYCDWHYGTN